MTKKDVIKLLKMGVKISHEELGDNIKYVYIRNGKLKDNNGYPYVTKKLLFDGDLNENNDKWKIEYPDKSIIVCRNDGTNISPLLSSFTVMVKISDTSFLKSVVENGKTLGSRKMKSIRNTFTEDIFTSKCVNSTYNFIDEIDEETRKYILDILK